MEYLVVKWLHVLASTFLFGTGVGSAFYLLFVSLTRDARAAAVVARYVVVADWLFTTPTVVLQPVTGLYLARVAGFALDSHWLLLSMILYGIAVACWLPVIWLQLRLRDIATRAARIDSALPRSYWRLLLAWAALGVPAFVALVAVFYLMVAKPA
jgi:uncharacterized membrane protein